MEADVTRVLGSLTLEGEESDEVFVPPLAYERVEEKIQYSLVGKVFISKKFSVKLFKDSIKALWGGHEE
ncbi:hypothetical protein LIER_40111 [Lithospermum erythrorhizon]|uniref:Uncharacterized protein n=1 Tax=Lithospermum erythrorhizon TaxID=34254 RepID=A0AAV3QQZ6_LITER